MSQLTPAERAEKYARRMKGAVEDIRRGIERTSENPMAKAATKKEKMKANLNRAIDDGRWEAGLKKVSLEDWKDAAINKGVNRIAAGVDGAQVRLVEFHTNLETAQAQVKREVDKMPDITAEDRINRAVTQMRLMAKFKGQL